MGVLSLEVELGVLHVMVISGLRGLNVTLVWYFGGVDWSLTWIMVFNTVGCSVMVVCAQDSAVDVIVDVAGCVESLWLMMVIS